jgi:hypothetical protein
MTVSSSDPLGRRSLFWAQAADEESSRREQRPLGKHAFYSGASGGRGAKRGESRLDGDVDIGALAGRVSRSPWSRIGAGLGVAQSVAGPVVVECSSCRERSEVSVGQFVTLHFPFWVWRPGRGYARLMTCPACRHRAWLSASWRPWSR